jgi:hypothetical protein
MLMPPALRKFMLSLHLVSSMGWLGAVVAYLALDLTAAGSQDPETLRSVWTGMGLIVSVIIVPLAIASLLTGIIQSLGTKWGLFDHWWVLISLALTIFATVVLVIKAPDISAGAAAFADPSSGHVPQGNSLLHSIGGLVILLFVTVINVFKPAGLTPWGWKKQQSRRVASK